MIPPRRAVFFFLAAALALLFASVASSFSAPPVIDPIPLLDPANPAATRVPVGKALVVPVSASNAAGGVISFKATSSNARLPVRVKTGNPILRVHVKYKETDEAGAFEGDLDFQLFRDFAPTTAGFIAGFAQAGFYDGLTFHRVIEDFVAQGGDPAGTGSGFVDANNNGQRDSNEPFLGLPFSYENEFHPGLIFTGRGQLAMANSGVNRGQPFGDQILLGNFRATNGSQFFISFQQLRGPAGNLDFKHTIFGQLIRGFDLLDLIEQVPTDARDKPLSPVKMVTATVLPGTSEATLLVGATGVGEATITLFATNAAGEIAKRTFPVRTADDTVNSPPVMLPLTPLFARVGSRPQLSVNAFDLEFDHLLYGIAAAGSGTSPNSFGAANLTGSYTARETAGLQTLALGVAGLNDELRFLTPSSFNPFGPFEAYKFEVMDLVFGDKIARPELVALKGAPGVELTGAVVGKLHDLDPAGGPANFTAQINWGDGTAPTAGTVSRDLTAPGAATYAVSGTHTYARPGHYAVTVAATGNQGAPAIIRSSAVISAAPLVATGVTLDVVSAKLTNRILATFTDVNSTRRASDYKASIDWGDGVVSRGLVSRAANGSFIVRGSHTYKDPQTYAIAVQIDKADMGATAWSSATMRFNAARSLPPFPQAHFAFDWDTGPAKGVSGQVGGTFNPANLQVEFTGNLFVSSSGNRPVAAPKIRFWLSNDATLQTTGGSADTRLFFDVPTFSLTNINELPLATLAPGVQGAIGFRIRPVKGQSATGKYLITEVVYSDPIADHSAVDKVVVTGPIDPALILFDFVSSVNAAGNQTSEAGGTVTFKVVLDTAPTADVKFAVESNTVAEGTVAPAELTFTAANWAVPQTVTVTGVDDAADDGNKTYKVILKTPVTTDPNYLGLPAREITLTNVDNDPTP